MIPKNHFLEHLLLLPALLQDHLQFLQGFPVQAFTPLADDRIQELRTEGRMDPTRGSEMLQDEILDPEVLSLLQVLQFLECPCAGDHEILCSQFLGLLDPGTEGPDLCILELTHEFVRDLLPIQFPGEDGHTAALPAFPVIVCEELDLELLHIVIGLQFQIHLGQGWCIRDIAFDFRLLLGTTFPETCQFTLCSLLFFPFLLLSTLEVFLPKAGRSGWDGRRGSSSSSGGGGGGR